MESIFETKEQYLEFKKNWKKATNDKEGTKLEFQHFILYAILKSKDYTRCIADTSTDKTKELADYITKESKYKYLSLWPFGDTITEEMLLQARERLENN